MDLPIVVTGATGFLGGALVRRLRAEGRSVIATGRDRRRGAALARETGARFEPADLAMPTETDRVIRGALAVVHSAALSSPWGDPRAFDRANVRATENVVQACERFHVARLVHVSTPAVYFDFRAREGIRESDPLPGTMVNDYARTKLEAERVVTRAHARGLATVILRPRALYGPGDTTILPRVVEALRRGQFPLLDGGRSLVDLTFIDDAVQALVCALSSDRAIGGTYHVTSGDPRPIGEVIAALADGLGLARPTRHVSADRALVVAGVLEALHRALLPSIEPRITRYTLGLLARTMTLDLTAARRDLGYAPRVALEEGLRRYLASLDVRPLPKGSA
ncbi:MAG: NAD-dependent epimerase/dehydratase family protein [Deltaproteobacteria bacterium]|nr:NAD-dependent epimerase/dehydratase family protein [Deltaproteobacteria bacterium]